MRGGIIETLHSIRNFITRSADLPALLPSSLAFLSSGVTWHCEVRQASCAFWDSEYNRTGAIAGSAANSDIRAERSPSRCETGGGTLVTAVETIALARWRGPFASEAGGAVEALERGRILYFPNLAFCPVPACSELLAAGIADRKTKNISYDPVTGQVKGTTAADHHAPLLQQMMAGYSETALRFVIDLFPGYAGGIKPGRASYRPIEIAGREYSRLKDDKLVHVDAFPSTPTRGRRILRLFCNINPAGKPRLWHIGAPFATLAERFLPRLNPAPAPVAYLLAALGVTRGRRSRYDQLMLALHNRAKRDAAFQAGAVVEKFAFPAGSSWLCFTDQVAHAALAGQYALEHTFYVDVGAMADPDRSPLRVLERMTGRKLT
jgi:hypothetical protein